MPDSAPFPSTSCRWNPRCVPDERSARYRHNGAVVWLTGLPGSGKSTLARALERRLFGNGGSPVLLDGDTLARRPQQRSRLLRGGPQPRTSAGSPKSPPISPATATSPSSPRSRPRARTAPPRAASPIPCSAKSMSRRRPRSARAAIPRATTPRRAPAHLHALHRHRQRLPAAGGVRIDASTPRRGSVAEATDEIERMLARSGMLFDELVDLAANI